MQARQLASILILLVGLTYSMSLNESTVNAKITKNQLDTSKIKPLSPEPNASKLKDTENDVSKSDEYPSIYKSFWLSTVGLLNLKSPAKQFDSERILRFASEASSMLRKAENQRLLTTMLSIGVTKVIGNSVPISTLNQIFFYKQA